MLVKRIGIDLGTANTLVFIEGQGIVLNEPTVVAVGADDSEVLAVGAEAKQMLGRTPADVVTSRPMRDGVIADYEVTETMLAYFIKKAVGKALFFKPEVVICVPAGCTQVESRAVIDAALSAGARQAFLVDEPLAAAIGAGIEIEAPSGNMIVDIGGGATEAAVISMGGVVTNRNARVGGNKLDEAIASYIRKQQNLIIGDQTAEGIKLKIGSAVALNKEESLETKGRDLVTGLPKSITITSSLVTEALRPSLNQILGAVKGVLEDTPPELASDIIDKGIVLSGGTSQLRGFDRYVAQETGVPAHVAEEPLYCVVKGIGIILGEFDAYKRAISYRK